MTVFTHASIDFDSPRENLSAKELFLFHKQLQEALNETANKVLDSFGIVANNPGAVVELSAPFQVGSEDVYEDFTEADLTAEIPPAKEENTDYTNALLRWIDAEADMCRAIWDKYGADQKGYEAAIQWYVDNPKPKSTS